MPSISAVYSVTAAAALLSQVAFAIDPTLHALLKRQSCPNIDSECSSVGSTLSGCINYVCKSCTSVDPDISRCCKLSTNLDISDCIIQNVGTGSPSDQTGSGSEATSADDSSSTNTFTGTSVAFPTTTGIFDTNPACSSLGSKIDACESATPGFTNYRLWDNQASCFCYQGSNYAPSSFDNYYSSCLGVLSTSDIGAYMDLTVGTGDPISTPCASIGNVKETAAATRQGGEIGGGSQNTRTTASPGGSRTAGNSLPTTTATPRTTPTPAGGSDQGTVAGSSSNGADGMPLKSAFALFASFAGLLYLL